MENFNYGFYFIYGLVKMMLVISISLGIVVW